MSSKLDLSTKKRANAHILIHKTLVGYEPLKPYPFKKKKFQNAIPVT